MNELEEKGFIVTKAAGTDWYMHKDTKTVKNTSNGEVLNEMFKYLPEDKEYMVIRDYKRDENEYEFSIILKDGNKYYFITDVPKQEVIME